MGKRSYLLQAMTIFVVLSITASWSMAACLAWGTECHYDCIASHPNGTCLKTKKVCVRVCTNDTFDVDRGGLDDASRPFKPQSASPSSTKQSYAEPKVVISGILERSTIDSKEIWIIVPLEASGAKVGVFKVYEIEPGKTPMNAFENKLVEVTGRLSGTINDKGYLPSLSATSIRALKNISAQ